MKNGIVNHSTFTRKYCAAAFNNSGKYVLTDYIQILLLVTLLITYIAPVSAASNNSTPDLMPNLADGWAGLPPIIQTWVFWILVAGIFAFLVWRRQKASEI